MPKPLLIIITGLPCTGKTTLGKKIAERLQLPFISRDNFKEILFDTLGFSDREWSKKMGKASYSVLYHTTEQILKANKSLIVETNFDPKLATIKLNELIEKYKFMPFQIRCYSDGQILYDRFRQRANSAGRHLGHIDDKNVDEFKTILKCGKIDLLEIGGHIYDIDTTCFKNIDHNKLFTAIELQSDF